MNRNFFSSTRTLLGTFALAMALGPLACTNVVVGDPGQGPTTGGVDEDPPDPSAPFEGGTAIAALQSRVPNGMGSPGVDPDTLYVAVSSATILCSDPVADMGCPSWGISIGIPPALQQPGKLLLSSSGLLTGFTVRTQTPGSVDCPLRTGAFTKGSIEILSADASQVTFRLEGTQNEDFDADGKYTAPHCFTP